MDKYAIYRRRRSPGRVFDYMVNFSIFPQGRSPANSALLTISEEDQLAIEKAKTSQGVLNDERGQVFVHLFDIKSMPMHDRFSAVGVYSSPLPILGPKLVRARSTPTLLGSHKICEEPINRLGQAILPTPHIVVQQRIDQQYKVDAIVTLELRAFAVPKEPL